MLDKAALLQLFAQARKRAEQGDLDIEAQHEIISALERKGLDATKAKAVLAKFVVTQDVDLTEMERLLDELEKPEGR